jgi:NitT/TauT family transport system ATP-binding protein
MENSSMDYLCHVNHVSYSYHSPDGETKALDDIDFFVNEGDFLAIVGPSGCGKSTLLSMICGLLTPSDGCISMGTIQTADEVHPASLGYMFQKDQLFEWRTVEKNILLGLEITHRLTEENLAYANELIERYGLSRFRSSRPSELSGGMRQRAALIRTLVMHPDILLLDEPFSALDYQTRLRVGDDIGGIIKEQHKTAVLVTHDLSEAVSLGSRIIVLSSRPGRIRCVITTDFDEELSPFMRRSTPQFKDYFNMIWKEMNEDGNTFSSTD